MKDNFFPKTMAIRVPGLLTRLVAAEVSKRNFFKKNGQGNENEFFNKILPNMLKYRAKKKGVLRDFFEKNIKESINNGMQERILDLLTESFDYLYFKESDDDCNDTIHLRFDVKNEFLYAELFTQLDTIGLKRGAYLRTLIQEYLKQSEHQKERICFEEEYEKLLTAIENEFIVQFQYKSERISAYALALEFSAKSEHWFLLYFKEADYKKVYSVPLYEIKNILLTRKAENVPEPNVSQKIHEIIDSGTFDDFAEFILGDDHNA